MAQRIESSEEKNETFFYPEQLNPEDRKHYLMFWRLDDGRLCGLHRLLMHWTVVIDMNENGYQDRYCFETAELAIEAFDLWNGKEDPINWHRHPLSGRRRPDKTINSEYINY